MVSEVVTSGGNTSHVVSLRIAKRKQRLYACLRPMDSIGKRRERGKAGRGVEE